MQRWRHRSGPYRALDHSFGLRTTDPALGRWLEETFSSLAVDAPPPTQWYGVVSDGRSPAPAVLIDEAIGWQGVSDEQLVSWLLWRINHDTISTCGDVVLHSSAVTDAGGTLLVVGRSGAGKSTLAAALARSGLGYVTDEAVGITPTGRVRPWPKPLALSPHSLELLGIKVPEPADLAATGVERLVPVASIGEPDRQESTTASAVVLLGDQEGEDLAPVRRADMVVRLMDHVLKPEERGVRSISAVAAALTDARCWTVGRLPLDAIAERLGVLARTTQRAGQDPGQLR